MQSNRIIYDWGHTGIVTNVKDLGARKRKVPPPPPKWEWGAAIDDTHKSKMMVTDNHITDYNHGLPQTDKFDMEDGLDGIHRLPNPFYKSEIRKTKETLNRGSKLPNPFYKSKMTKTKEVLNEESYSKCMKTSSEMISTESKPPGIQEIVLKALNDDLLKEDNPTDCAASPTLVSQDIKESPSTTVTTHENQKENRKQPDSAFTVLCKARKALEDDIIGQKLSKTRVAASSRTYAKPTKTNGNTNPENNKDLSNELQKLNGSFSNCDEIESSKVEPMKEMTKPDENKEKFHKKVLAQASNSKVTDSDKTLSKIQDLVKTSKNSPSPIEKKSSSKEGSEIETKGAKDNGTTPVVSHLNETSEVEQFIIEVSPYDILCIEEEINYMWEREEISNILPGDTNVNQKPEELEEVSDHTMKLIEEELRLMEEEGSDYKINLFSDKEEQNTTNSNKELSTSRELAPEKEKKVFPLIYFRKDIWENPEDEIIWL